MLSVSGFLWPMTMMRGSRVGVPTGASTGGPSPICIHFSFSEMRFAVLTVASLRCLRWKLSVADIFYVRFGGSADVVGDFGVAAGVLGNEVFVEAEEVVEDLHLAVTVFSGADSDGG